MVNAKENAADSVTDPSAKVQLAEIVSPEAAKTTNLELKVSHSNIIPYSYQHQGRTVTTSKLQVLLQSKAVQESRTILFGRGQIAKPKPCRAKDTPEAIPRGFHLEVSRPQTPQREAGFRSHLVSHRHRLAEI